MKFHQRASVLIVSAAILTLATSLGAQAAEGAGAAPVMSLAQAPAPAATPAEEKATAPAEKTPGAAETPAAAAEKPVRATEKPARTVEKPRAAAKPIVRPVRQVRRDVYRVASRYEVAPPVPVRSCGFWCGPFLIIGIGY